MSIKAVILIALVLFIATSQGSTLKEKEADGLSREIAVSTFFEGIRDNPEELRAFFLSMPKGGDLHNHLTGAVYAEGLIDAASSDSLCIYLNNYSTTKNCSGSNKKVSKAYSDPQLYSHLVDAWSKRTRSS